MLKNYITVAIRNLLRNKTYTCINIFGFATALTCIILIGLFVHFELSFDTFHEKTDRIYRVAKENPGDYYLGKNKSAVTPAPLVQALMNEIPEVEYAVQVRPVEVMLGVEDSRFHADGLYTTRHFFDVFSFGLLQGNPQTALVEPNSVILTASMAQNYFDEANPIGQTLFYASQGDEGLLTVVGVVEDPPPNSSLLFNCLISMTSSSRYRQLLEMDKWDSNPYQTFVSLYPESNLQAFKEKLVSLAQTYLGQVSFYQNNPAQIPIYFPQFLMDIHLHSQLNSEFLPNADIKIVYLFFVIGLLILLIACINYMNLATVQSRIRAKEIGVRKVIGAHRIQLCGQFIGEAVVLSTVALVLALYIVPLLLPIFNSMTGRTITFGWTDHSIIWLIIVGVSLGMGFISGSYTAFVLSGQMPIRVIRGVLQNRKVKTTFRNTLVIAQFAITSVLIVCTIAIYQQMHYIQTANTGIERDHVISFMVRDLPGHAQYTALKHALAENPNVLDVAASLYSPIEIVSTAGTNSWEGAHYGQYIEPFETAIQPGYVELFGIELVEEHSVSEEFFNDGMYINEKLKNELGWDVAVGKWIYFQGRKRSVIGVMKNFNFMSFHQAIAPLALYFGGEGQFNYVFVKVQPEQLQETLVQLKATMATFWPGYPFEYEFIDDAYNQMYQKEIQLGRLIRYFTGIALLIASLGLLGLAAFLIAQRTKEIGIRKVLGASVIRVVTLLSKEFLVLILIADIIACPIAYYAMNKWLQNFAYRAGIVWWMFALAGGLSLAIALLTVSYQVVRAATANPVESLRYE